MSATAAGRSKAYHRLKYAVFFADLALGATLLTLLQFTPLGARLADYAENISPWRPLQIAVYMTVFSGAFYALSFPLSVYSGHALERRYALTDQRFGGWLLQEIKKASLSLPLFVLSMEALFWAAERFPDTWWIWAGAGWFVLAAVLTRLLPTVILPLFYPVTPLEDGSLKKRVLALCGESGVEVLGAYRIALSRTTKKANAALVGIGKSRRVLLADTLLGYPEEEIAMVVAHEIGHHALGHIAKSLLFSGALAAAGFYALKEAAGVIVSSAGASSVTDLAVFPVLTFLVSAAGLLVLPLENAFSRRMEREADRFALGRLPSAETFRSLMERLGRQNLGDPAPNPVVEFVFYSHPSLANRLRHAETVLAARDPRSVS